MARVSSSQYFRRAARRDAISSVEISVRVGGHRHAATKALDAGLSSLDDFVIFPNLRGRNALRVQFHVPLELKFCMRMKEKPVRMASLMLILRLAN